MDGVLDSASVLCVFKLVCNLLCLPSLATSRSPVGFCGCCILIFTDFLLTVYLSFLGLFESWLVELVPPLGVIALRFLLFLSHTYGAVLILLTPLVAVETFGKFLWMTREEEDDDDDEDEGRDEKGGWQCHAIGYLCCLSVWVAVALSLRCGWRLEEARATACLARGGSLMRCLPNLLSPLPSAMRPCWGVALLYLILILLTCSLLLLTQAMASDSQRCSSKEKVCMTAPLQMPRRNGRRGSNLALALLAVLGMLVLPLYLGVNVLLLRSVETLLEACISFFLASVSRGSSTDVVTLV
ncbi:uncharacterized protein LOC109529190 [Hippocampus comes]|uniref:uncharacterized protein LOC109529190 n=1 Tax=Hippocampus comes TaxID=109280 RepID=UPI00094E0117|nr:PREDICTED: uncharacterized protein LOC109529190 [Hippocampus comes]XP_019747989.1 PREDICTED: uncharacterized protein LOC109529190 [Hippocampus comes]XP_019747991.1 PREDICTED: uncharacterized protein LOC109529190 [Hippocampus comes]XP_019747992.1 PREDICTED: uncharacterized protein LOC109529190 [Hippocampus comes]